MMKCGRITVGVFCCLASAGAAAAQGVYWESQVTAGGGMERVAQNYAMPKMTKIIGSGGKVVIIRADQDKVISVDTKKHTYQEMTFAEVESSSKAMQSQMEAARAQLEHQMKNASPEQRAMMEKALPKLPGTEAAKSLEVKKTGETKTVAGHPCTKYVATDGTKTILVAWTANDIKGFDGLREDWIAYQKRIAGGSRTIASTMAETYAKIDGFPMETEMGDVKTVVTKVESRSIPASDFEVPAGYKKENPPLPQAGQPRK
jgi:hypothetical protein